MTSDLYFTTSVWRFMLCWTFIIKVTLFFMKLVFLNIFSFLCCAQYIHRKKCCAYVWSSFMNLLQQQAQMSLCYVPLARDDWKTGQILWTTQMKSTDTIAFATTMDKIFETNLSFYVKKRTENFNFYFSTLFC